MASKLPKLMGGRRRIRLVFLVLNGIAQAFAVIGIALLTKNAFDASLSTSETEYSRTVVRATIFQLGGWLAVCMICNGLLRWRAQVDAEQLAQSYVHAVRSKLFSHVGRLGDEGVQKLGVDVTKARFAGDLSALRDWITHGMARLIVNGLALGIAILILLAIDPMVAIPVVATGCVALAFTFALRQPLRNAAKAARRCRVELVEHINSKVTNIGSESRWSAGEHQRVRVLSNKLRSAMVSRAKVVGLLRSLVESGAGVVALGTVLAAAVLMIDGRATAGSIVAALATIGLLAPRFAELGRALEYRSAALAAREKQNRVFAIRPTAKQAQQDRATLDIPEGQLRLERVFFKPVLTNINCYVKPGQRLAIIGTAEAEKSTLLRVIGGLVVPTKGRIFFGGEDLTPLKEVERTDVVALVSRELPRPRASILDNLLYGVDKVSPTRLERVLKFCGLDAWAIEQADGLNTQLKDMQRSISVAEQVRISLARALLARPKVLLLDGVDEVLNDTDSSERLFDRVFKSFPGIVLFTTVSGDHAMNADHVLHIEGGHAIAQGTPELVLAPGSESSLLFAQTEESATMDDKVASSET